MMTLRQIQQAYNDLVPLAHERGMTDVRAWTAIPAIRDIGLRRLNDLRVRLGMDRLENAPEVQASTGAILPLSTIREQWNALVPQAQQQGLNVQLWRGNPTTGRRGMDRLNWLRSQLGQSATAIMETSTPSTVTRTRRSRTTRVATIPSSPISDLDDSWMQGLTFGVEIECIKPRSLHSADISLAIRNAGLSINVEAYNHTIRNSWKIVTDGSLGDYTNGIEIVSPILSGKDGLEQIAKVCQVLVAHRVKVSKRCGFHVHVGARSEQMQTLRNVAKIYLGYNKTIRGLLAPSREDNSYCRPNWMSPAIDAASNVITMASCIGQNGAPRSGDRYRALNFLTLHPASYGTIEFRQHQGTIEADKAVNWVRFCLRTLVAARTHQWDEARPRDLETLMSILNLNDQERAFFTQRFAYFARRREMANRRRAA